MVISSDAAARGVDVPHLSAVVQYDAPAHVKTYVHRVGRTARAGSLGVSYTLLRPQQVGLPVAPVTDGPTGLCVVCCLQTHLCAATTNVCLWPVTLVVVAVVCRCPQVHHFKAMMKRIDNDRVRKETVVTSAIALLVPRYKLALEQVCLWHLSCPVLGLWACSRFYGRVSRALAVMRGAAPLQPLLCNMVHPFARV